MRLRALAGIAVAAFAAVTALAFENTYWYGGLNCKVKAKIQKMKAVHSSEDVTGVSLSTTNTTFNQGPISGSAFSGLIIKKNNTHYVATQPAPGTDLDAFIAWVKAKIVNSTGIDVDILTVETKGSFTLIHSFEDVRENIKIKWTGTVATGENAGQPVSGSIKLKGSLPRD